MGRKGGGRGGVDFFSFRRWCFVCRLPSTVVWVRSFAGISTTPPPSLLSALRRYSVSPFQVVLVLILVSSRNKEQRFHRCLSRRAVHDESRAEQREQILSFSARRMEALQQKLCISTPLSPPGTNPPLRPLVARVPPSFFVVPLPSTERGSDLRPNRPTSAMRKVSNRSGATRRS